MLTSCGGFFGKSLDFVFICKKCKFSVTQMYEMLVKSEVIKFILSGRDTDIVFIIIYCGRVSENYKI